MLHESPTDCASLQYEDTVWQVISFYKFQRNKKTRQILMLVSASSILTHLGHSGILVTIEAEPPMWKEAWFFSVTFPLFTVSLWFSLKIETFHPVFLNMSLFAYFTSGRQFLQLHLNIIRNLWHFMTIRLLLKCAFFKVFWTNFQKKIMIFFGPHVYMKRWKSQDKYPPKAPSKMDEAPLAISGSDGNICATCNEFERVENMGQGKC